MKYSKILYFIFYSDTYWQIDRYELLIEYNIWLYFINILVDFVIFENKTKRRKNVAAHSLLEKGDEESLKVSS